MNAEESPTWRKNNKLSIYHSQEVCDGCRFENVCIRLESERWKQQTGKKISRKLLAEHQGVKKEEKKGEKQQEAGKKKHKRDRMAEKENPYPRR